jgi:nitrate reductase gamma subunit
MSATSKKTRDSNGPWINIVIGLLSVVLVVLVVALTMRLLTPRIITERDTTSTNLISDVIQIQVLNGCGVSGVASRFTSKLRQSGFDVVESGNFETFDVQKTFVIDRSGNLENAKRVAVALGISEDQIIREVAMGFYLDATVVIGFDFDQLNLQ